MQLLHGVPQISTKHHEVISLRISVGLSETLRNNKNLHRMKDYSEYNELTHTIIGCAIEVNKILGPGLLESAYQKCLSYELKSKGLFVEEELLLPIVYKSIQIDQGYRIDLLVDKKIVLELKTVDMLTDVHEAQVLTYLKLGKFPIG